MFFPGRSARLAGCPASKLILDRPVLHEDEPTFPEETQPKTRESEFPIKGHDRARRLKTTIRA